jgi:hypothetical protein
MQINLSKANLAKIIEALSRMDDDAAFKLCQRLSRKLRSMPE